MDWRELVIDQTTGLLVSDRKESFQRAIARLDDESLRRELSANARDHIAQNFSLTSIADRWEQLFEELYDPEHRQPIRFPRKPVLPPPFPAFGTQDERATRVKVAMRRARELSSRILSGIRS